MVADRPAAPSLLSGKSASGLKEVAESFQQGMAEGETGISKEGGTEAIKADATEVKEEEK